MKLCRVWGVGLAACVLLLQAGCATLTSGVTQTVEVVTPGVAGAQCVLRSKTIGEKTVTTPAKVVLRRGGHNIDVTCTKACYAPGKGVISSMGANMTAGNIILGGAIGFAIDSASGAGSAYQSKVEIALKRLPSC